MARPLSPQEREAVARADVAEAEAEIRRLSLETRRRLLARWPVLVAAVAAGFVGGFVTGRASAPTTRRIGLY